MASFEIASANKLCDAAAAAPVCPVMTDAAAAATLPATRGSEGFAEGGTAGGEPAAAIACARVADEEPPPPETWRALEGSKNGPPCVVAVCPDSNFAIRSSILWECSNN